METTTSKYFHSNVETMNGRILAYLSQLEPPVGVEATKPNVRWLHPFKNGETWRCVEAFYGQYYADARDRVLILGINPGRFGGGTTGVPFTDPIRLKAACNIDSSFPAKSELSAQFFYDHLFAAYPMKEFYQAFFIGAVCPLGLECNGRNMNYYDDKTFMHRLSEHFIPDQIEQQIRLGCSRKVAICLGEGVNYSTLSKLNEKYQFFEKILKVAHPRFIMQYKRKHIGDYVQQYVNACQLAQELAAK